MERSLRGSTLSRNQARELAELIIECVEPDCDKQEFLMNQMDGKLTLDSLKEIVNEQGRLTERVQRKLPSISGSDLESE